jgi:hypothetical protein
MADTSKLARPANRKGAPPERDSSLSVVTADPRPAEGKKQPLQVKIPAEVHAAFSARAGEEFGHTGGAKTKLFLAMWDAYIGQK